jgi:lipoyl(octanoyl) transferase
MHSPRLLHHPAASPAWNMAVDEALLRLATTPVLRIYQWNETAISLGYFQACTLVPPQRPYIRRYTGGGLVDHTQDVTYTLVFPRQHPLTELSLATSYELFHRAIVLALHHIGLEAELAAACSCEDSPACFRKPVKYDVVLNGQKIAGAAQRRSREGSLHQGSILLPDPTKNTQLRTALPSALATVLAVTWSLDELTVEEKKQAITLEKNRYSTPAWNQQK